MKILMVCLGNICRSPMAEGILRHHITLNGLDWEVSSCGTGSWHIGEPPHPDGQRAMLRKGIDISHQRAQQFHPHLFEEYDLIFAMDSSNYSDLIKMAITEEEKNKVQMIMNVPHPGSNTSVPDPYYNDHLYDQVFDMLFKACTAIIQQYQHNRL